MKIEVISPYRISMRGAHMQKSVIDEALNELSKVQFNKNDVIYLKSLGVAVPFENGAQAVECLKNYNVKIEFSHMDIEGVHARWQESTNTIQINEKYSKKRDFADILAISEAIFHESGHIKDRDLDNSIQEELDCLALNVLAHKFYMQKYKNVFENKKDFLFSQGVSLYEDLFYDFDPEKNRLKERIREKYGELNAGSDFHPPSNFALEIKSASIYI